MSDKTFSQNGNKRAALYARVSGVGQLDNTSPESQLSRCREYAQARDYIIAVERIEQISGAFVLARSVYNDFLNMAADGQIAVIVVDIPDRLGRGDAIAKCELLAEMNGAKVEYASPGRDTSTVEGLVQHSAVQIFEWCVTDGLSLHKIAKRLTEDGVTAPKGKSPQWYPGTVRFVLLNETYTGVWHYAKMDVKRLDDVDGIKRTVKPRDKSEWIPVQVPAIITSELYQAARTQLDKRRVKGFKPAKHDYLLRGRVRCARCNWLMQCNPYRGYFYYACRKNRYDFRAGSCPSLRVDLADTLVWEKIKERLKDERALFEGIEAERAEAERAMRMIQGTIVGLQSDNRKAQSKIDRWLDLYGDGGMTKEQFDAKKKSVENDIRRRAGEIAEWQAKLADFRIISLEQQAELERYRADIVLGIDNATFEEKCKYMEWLKVECIYDGQTGDLTITGLLGQCSCCIERFGIQSSQ